MKISKRILGVALALIMILNVFAVGTFAAADAAVTLMISTDKNTYAPGEEIVITLSEQVVEAVGAMNASGQYEIGYSSSVLTPISTSTKVADHGLVDLSGDLNTGNSIVALTEACQGNGSYIREEDAEAYGWNETIALVTTYKDGIAFDATAAPLKILSFKMKIADDAANGTYTIGFNQGGYEAYFAYSTDVAMQGIYGYSDDYGYGTTANYDCGTVTFTVGEEASNPIYYKQTQYRPNGEAFDIGVKFAFKPADIDIKFYGEGEEGKAGQSKNVACVGADVYKKIDGQWVEADGTFESPYVYLVGEEYQYRVILEARTEADTAEYKIVPYAVYTDTTLDTVYGEEVIVKPSEFIAQINK